MASSPIGTVLGGILSPNATGIPPGVGMCVINIGRDVWLPYNQALAFVGGLIGIVVTPPAAPGTSLQALVSGALPYSAFNIGSGNYSPIVAGVTPARSASGQVIGYCDPSGEISLLTSYLGQTVATPLVLGPRVSANAPFTSMYAGPPIAVTGTINVTNGSPNFTLSSGATGAGQQDLFVGGSGVTLTGINEISSLVGTSGTFLKPYGGVNNVAATCLRVASSTSLFSTPLTVAVPSATWLVNVQGYVTLANSASAIRAGVIYISGSQQTQAVPWSMAASQPFLTVPINQDIPESNSYRGGTSQYYPTVLPYCSTAGAGSTDVAVANNASFISATQVSL